MRAGATHYKRIVVPFPGEIVTGGYGEFARDADKALGLTGARQVLDYEWTSITMLFSLFMERKPLDLVTAGVWMDTWLRHAGVLPDDKVVNEFLAVASPTVAGGLIIEICGFDAAPDYVSKGLAQGKILEGYDDD